MRRRQDVTKRGQKGISQLLQSGVKTSLNRVQTHSECEILRQRQKLGEKDNHKNAVGKINCVRNRVKESRRTTPDYRSNLFTQDLCDVKCNIQMEIIQTTHSSTIYLVAIIIPIGEHRYGLQHTLLIVEDI